MNPRRFHIGRVIVACAAVVAQCIPASSVWACGQSCCSRAANRACCTRSMSAEQDSSPPCPLCGPTQPEQAPASPCHCHLKARHDQATPTEWRSGLDLEHPDHVAVVRVVDDSAAAAAELTRLALAAGRTIPQRPPRIMLGVWRN